MSLGFVAGVLVLWLAQPSARSIAIGAIVACVGEALRIWAAGHLNKAREVTASGPYRYFAHPLYIGSSVMGAGLAVASGSIVVAAIILVYLAVTFAAAIRSEQAFLQNAFGDRYDRYRRGEATEQTLQRGRPFSIRQAVSNHEHRTVIGLALAVLLLLLRATYNGVFWGVAAGR